MSAVMTRAKSQAAFGQSVFEARAVELRYTSANTSVLALDRVSLDVKEGEFAVIVGPSGCGKSSLLYLAAGLLESTGGELIVGGQAVDGPGRDRGMVFQAYTLFPWLTVAENVEFGLKRRRLPSAERREIVSYYLNEVGLSQFAQHYPKQLSGGMKQRVAIARSLANDPKILLMDEPDPRHHAEAAAAGLGTQPQDRAVRDA
jgi:NitT/TauT family transport system ATP-binding protein